MTQHYRIIKNDFTDEYGEYHSTFHHFSVGTLVEMYEDDGTVAPKMVAVDGPDEGGRQYVPYDCMEAVVLGIKAEHVQ